MKAEAQEKGKSPFPQPSPLHQSATANGFPVAPRKWVESI